MNARPLYRLPPTERLAETRRLVTAFFEEGNPLAWIRWRTYEGLPYSGQFVLME